MKKILIALLIVVVAGGVIGGGAYYYQTKKQTKPITESQKGNTGEIKNEENSDGIKTPDLADVKTEEKSTLRKEASYGGYYWGTLNLEGYSLIEHKTCDGVLCKKDVDYVFFIITKSDTSVISDYLAWSEGNSHFKKDGIGLGCYDKPSQLFESVGPNGNNQISKDDLNRLLASNQNNTIKIQVTVPNDPKQGLWNDCASNYTNIQLIK